MRSPSLRAFPVLCLLLSGMSSDRPLRADEGSPGGDDLSELSLEELMDVEIISVSRKAERLGDAPAAVYVISADEIRRSGALTLADALHLAPGLNVARVGGSLWAVSARGFNHVFSDRLLVLVDGRTVFTPLFSGVYWEVQDYPLEDIARIEVIRGPGGTMWGANAENGVISIITKSAQETSGTQSAVAIGNVDRYIVTARYGGTTSGGTAYRVYGKARAVESFERPDGSSAHDGAALARTGFRIDHDGASTDLTLLGNLYDGNVDTLTSVTRLEPPLVRTEALDTAVSGLDLVARAQVERSAGQAWSIQASVDRLNRKDHLQDIKVATIDLDLQERLAARARGEIVWGAGLRHVDAHTVGTFDSFLDPADYAETQASIFVQHEARSRTGRWRRIVGAKLEHFEQTGLQFQPSLRFAWRPDVHHSIWGAASSAVHTPSLGQRGVQIHTWIDPAGAPPVLGAVRGQESIDTERAVAYELGYRWNPNARIAVAIATSLTEYDGMINTEVRPTEFEMAPFPHAVVPIVLANAGGGRCRAVELEVDAKPRDGWQLRTSYGHVSVDSPPFAEAASDYPAHQLLVRSSHTIVERIDLDLTYRYVSRLDLLHIDGYHGLDLRLAWACPARCRFALLGQNLLERSHLEFVDNFANVAPVEVQRSFVLTSLWTF